MIGGLVLAAGEGRRFGAPKQLAELDGRPLLEHAVSAMTSALPRVVVVLGAHADAVRRGVRFGPAEVVVCDAWAEGQSASLRAGVAALADPEAVVVTLGDQPFVTAEAIRGVVARRASEFDAVRVVHDGAPGHPVLLERAALERVCDLRGDVGARAALGGLRVFEWDCPASDPTDIDTPEKLEEVKA